ncbi:MAG: M6 family metalloprotease domain-containing protein [Akkermansiaceae bacterium]
MLIVLGVGQVALGHGYHEHRTSKFTQPDGTVLNLVFHGSELYARAETADGYTVIFDSNTKAYHYATLSADGSAFVSTGKMAGKADPKSLGLAKRAKLNPRARATKIRERRAEVDAVLKERERWESLKKAKKNYRAFKKEVRKKEKAGKKGFAVPMGTIFPDTQIPEKPELAEGGESSGEAGAEFAPPSFTLTENVVGLTILVDFSDVPGTAVTQAQVDDWANKPNYTGFSNAGSVYDYFYVQSNGRLRYSNNVTYYVRVPNPKTYYDDTSKGSGICGRLLLNDALDVLIADGYDFTPLTTKSGGRIRACNVFFAGGDSGVWSKGLWPHRWVLSPQKEVSPGMYVYDYQITDIGNTTDLKIGTFLHENGHMLLGYPDFYSYDGNAARIGRFSLMASGNHAGSGRHPTNLDSYMKEASGWMDVVDLNSASHQRCAVQVDGNLAYRFSNPSESSDYFMWEVRDNTGWEGPYGGASGSVNPTSGLLAWHVYEGGSNTYSSIFTGDSPNADYSTPYELLVVEANPSSNTTPWYDDPNPGSNDAFKSSNKSEISDSTTPALKFWDTDTDTGRTVTSNCEIHSVSADGPAMTFVIGSGIPGGSPQVVLSRKNIYVSCNEGANAPIQTFSVCNGQGGTLNYNISDDASWITTSSSNGSVTTGDDTITVTLNTAGLSSNNYTGTITVDDGASGSETITVHLTVFNQPTLSVNPTSLTMDGIEGFSGSNASINLSNVGGGSCNYSVSKTQPWLTLSHTSGSLVMETDQIVVTCDASSLAPGVYNDTITITSSEASNSSLTVPVSFNVISSDMVVTYPDGGESFAGGGTETITWVSSLDGSVKIDLYKGGVIDHTIANSEANDGSFDWQIPFGTNGSDYRIRITSSEQGTKFDESDADFIISSCSSFETDLDGWEQDTNDELDWIRLSGSTVSSNTGPSSASDGFNYLYIEASSPNFPDKTAIIYKDLNFAGINQPLMTFDYHMYGSNMGELYVEVSTDEGANWLSPAIWSQSGNQGNAWVTEQTVDLGDYAGQTVRVRFRGVTGSGWSSDIAIDNVCFSEGSSGSVQFANAGLFSVNEADGSATITVERVGDTSAAISVEFATSNGSASGDSDFTNASGILSWSAGDATPKTFTVTILDDSAHEAVHETVVLTMSNPVNAAIAGINPGTLNIQEDDNNAPNISAGLDRDTALVGSVPWTPSTIVTELWLDANDASTLTTSIIDDVVKVQQWNDKSGNARHASQSNAGSRPTSGARTIGGKNILGFAQSNSQFLNLPAVDVIGKEIWSVFMIDNYAASSSQLLLGAGGNVQIGINSSSQNMRLWKASNPYSGDSRSTTTIAQSAPAVAGWLAHLDTKKFSINGILETTSNNYTSGGMSPTYVGRGQYAYIDGAIGEIIITNGQLTTDDRQNMEGYLSHKWGLESNLPPSHPYKGQSPGSAMNASVTINDASASDADGDLLTYTWSQVSGTGTAVFDDVNVLNPSVTFTEKGDYDLQLSVFDGYETSTSVVTITVLTAYESWSGRLPVDQDANKDGVSNDIAWILGAANPSANATGLLPKIDSTSDANYYIYNYRRSDLANLDSGTIIAMQYGNNLSGWTTAVHNGTDVIIEQFDDDYEAGVDRVEVKLRKTLVTGDRFFARLYVHVTE